MTFLQSTLTDCQLVSLPKEHNRAGNLTALNSSKDLSFDIKRVYYTYDIPSGASRGGHAHRQLYQYVIAACGSFDVLLDDGTNQKTVRLNRPDVALLIVPGIWRELHDFSSGAVCLVLASELYQADDYLEEYEDFKRQKGCR
ncbi:MAG: FdtA/QdtA family cupin domain-containing protein [Bacteroidales bacterium]|nr:FdtA/QdtA family cupin domain-containing protein [Bacteroidales bacterium]